MTRTRKSTPPATAPATQPAARASVARAAGPASTGVVVLMGAGPGDPGLLTLRAAERLAAADVVVADLARFGPVVDAHCRADADRVDVRAGERGGTPTEAARALARHARDGRTVVRLFPGDPFLGAAAAEQAAALTKTGVQLEVVPGVPEAAGVPAYAGIPLTTAKGGEVRVVDAAAGKVDWAGLGSGAATVVLTGVDGNLASVASSLVAAGRPGSTPVAVTSDGTSAEQRTVVATLEDVAAEVKAAKLGARRVVVVGDAVAMRERLSWFESRALFGWRVLVPRTKEQAGDLTVALRSHGAVPEVVPTIAVEPPRTPHQMERAIKGLVTGRYEWVAFTSRNAVRAVRERFEEYGLDSRAFAGLKVAAVGEGTAADLLAWGIKADLVPQGEQSAAGLVEEWPAYDSVFDPINRVFLPRADIATDTLVAGLVELGWEVEDVTAYRTVRAAPPAPAIRDAIKTGGYDAVVFTSSSTVRNLVGIAGKPHPATVVAVIGPQTARTAEEHGLRVDVLARRPSAAALAEALAEYGEALRADAEESGDPVVRPSQRKGARRKP